MPVTASPYFTNPEMANISGNLATAIFGDPETRMKRDYYGSEVTKNNADARKLGAEADLTGGRYQAQQQMTPEAMATLAPLPGETPIQHTVRVAPLLSSMARYGTGAKDTAEGTGSMLGDLWSLGNTDDKRTSLVMLGKMPGKDFAGSRQESDQIEARDAGEDRRTKFGVAHIDQAGALARTNAEQEGALSRLFATALNVAPGHNAYLAPRDPRRTAAGPDGVIHGAPTYETVRGRAGTDILDIPDGQPVPSHIAAVFDGGRTFTAAAKPSVQVTGKSIDDAVLQAAKTVPGAITDTNGKQTLNPAFEASFDPAAVRRARAAAGDTFQRTKSASSAASAYLAALGIQGGDTYQAPGLWDRIAGDGKGQIVHTQPAAPAAVPPVVNSPADLPPPAQRKLGMTITTPKGNMTWTAGGWVPAAN